MCILRRLYAQLRPLLCIPGLTSSPHASTIQTPIAESARTQTCVCSRYNAQAVLLTRRQDKGVVPVNIRHDRALSDSGVAERQPVPQAKMRARPLKLSFSSFRFFPLCFNFEDRAKSFADQWWTISRYSSHLRHPPTNWSTSLLLRWCHPNIILTSPPTMTVCLERTR